MLHIVKTMAKLPLVFACSQPEDSILLIEEAVYAARSGSALLNNYKTQAFVFVLQEDLEARGCLQGIDSSYQVVDMEEFVGLTVKYVKSITW
ncbi:sulfurtransferase complex subunit TusB [Vibrio palustris]|uniref:Protein TusB n=1 Tax=Vibrio palustris TaxID=1918946 RepID=A0A1R4B8G9_9VIBR|nr:sulfurtransferase complex subunit TusB [Vibrio palustris]SJL85204.1 Protein TusB [Vibrio palustris]